MRPRVVPAGGVEKALYRTSSATLDPGPAVARGNDFRAGDERRKYLRENVDERTNARGQLTRARERCVPASAGLREIVQQRLQLSVHHRRCAQPSGQARDAEAGDSQIAKHEKA